MDLKQRTKEELEKRVEKLEKFIAEKGIGSGYLSKIQRAQRNVNIVLVLGAVTAIAGLTIWTLSQSDDEDED